MSLKLSTQNFFGTSETELKEMFCKWNVETYRVHQVFTWVYHYNCRDFSEMSNISKSLRSQLAEHFHFSLPKVQQRTHSKDGSIKYLLKLNDGAVVECVWMPSESRKTLCLSTQVGCRLNCSFCLTASLGLKRNLTAGEIIGQHIAINEELEEKDQITNVVFMGMGEPLLNESPVYDACEILLDDWAFGLSRRKVTVSSSGIVPALIRMSDTVPVSLAISLHAPDDLLRDILVPINQKYPIKELMKACHYYLKAGTQERHILFEYVMLDGVNDSIEQAKELSKLLNYWFESESAKVNLIPFNPFPESQYKTSSPSTIDKFQDVLFKAGIRTTTRRTRGDDVDAACGQLAGKVLDKSRRNAERNRLLS